MVRNACGSAAQPPDRVGEERGIWGSRDIGEDMTNDASARAESGEPDENADVPPTRRNRTKAIIWATAGVVATAIGAASIVVPMIADAQQRTTSTDTLVLNPTSAPKADALPTSAPVAAALDLGLDFTEQNTIPVEDGAGADMTFWVPVDAPWATFPDDGWQLDGAGNAYGCSQAQYEWLVDQAVSKPTSGGLYDFVNSASDGGALSIRSIRPKASSSRRRPRASRSTARARVTARATTTR